MNNWIKLEEETPPLYKQLWIIVVDSDRLPTVRLAWYNGYDFIGDIYSKDAGTSQSFTYPIPTHWIVADIPHFSMA
jgi:hypothetical protein